MLLASACGDASPPLAETSTDRLELEVALTPDPLVGGREATFELHVTNTSDRRALLTFDTTQRGDVVLSTGDVEVYRWAARRVFAQEPHEVAFAPGQTVRFPLEEEPLPVAPGDYELMATVTGVPKLRTIRTAASVVGNAATETPSPEPTGPPELSVAYVGVVADYAAVVDAGGRAALDAPQADLEQVAASLGPFVAVTAGGVIGSDSVTELFGAWSDAVAEAVSDGGRGGAVAVAQAHAAASESVDPLAHDVAQAYVEHLDPMASTLRRECVRSSRRS